MDGNDSLKRIRRRTLDDEGVPGASCEHIDTRTIGGDFYLARAEVDRWADEQIQEMMSTDGAKVRVILFNFIRILPKMKLCYRMRRTTICVLTDGKT